MELKKGSRIFNTAPDAIQLAVFEYTRCNIFVTNDEQLKK